MDEALDLLLIADDPLVRSALANALEKEPACQVVAQYSTGEFESEIDFLPQISVVIWDLGWLFDDVTRTSLKPLSWPLVALISGEDQLRVARNLGAQGVISRESEGPAIIAAARAVLENFTVFDERVVPYFMPHLDSAEEEIEESLTPRELDVIRLMAEGLTNKAIAQRLGISNHTVKFHVNSLLNKLQAQSRTEAVVRATRQGLIAL